MGAADLGWMMRGCIMWSRARGWVSTGGVKEMSDRGGFRYKEDSQLASSRKPPVVHTQAPRSRNLLLGQIGQRCGKRGNSTRAKEDIILR